LTSRDAELEQAKHLYESQITDLNNKLQEALHSSKARPKKEGDPSKAVESSLAASRAKMADLQKRHGVLLRKYTNLQSSLLDMRSGAKTQSTIVSTRSGITSDSSDAEVSAIVQGGDPPSPVRKRTRGRGFSDPELFVERKVQCHSTPGGADELVFYHGCTAAVDTRVWWGGGLVVGCGPEPYGAISWTG
jgi:hypothetical protein